MSAGVGAGWRPDIEALTDRMESMLRADGHPWPELAAVVLRDRGCLGLDRTAYAALVGLDEDRLAALEDGHGSTDPAIASPLRSVATYDGRHR